jgi:hypothetical protein
MVTVAESGTVASCPVTVTGADCAHSGAGAAASAAPNKKIQRFMGQEKSSTPGPSRHPAGAGLALAKNTRSASK